MREELRGEGRKEEHEAALRDVRASLREVLAQRQILVTSDEDARVERCTDRGTLLRWMRQAATARTAAEALR